MNPPYTIYLFHKNHSFHSSLLPESKSAGMSAVYPKSGFYYYLYRTTQVSPFVILVSYKVCNISYSLSIFFISIFFLTIVVKLPVILLFQSFNDMEDDFSLMSTFYSSCYQTANHISLEEEEQENHWHCSYN